MSVEVKPKAAHSPRPPAAMGGLGPSREDLERVVQEWIVQKRLDSRLVDPVVKRDTVRTSTDPLPRVDHDKWKTLVSRWSEHPSFDGVRGTPPPWVPKFIRQYFSFSMWRAATFLIAQSVDEDAFVSAVRTAAQSPSTGSIALLLQARMEGWILDEFSLLKLVDILHAVQLGEEMGLAYFADREFAGNAQRGAKFSSPKRGRNRLSREAMAVLERKGSDYPAKRVRSDLEDAGVLQKKTTDLRWQDDKGRQKKTTVKQFENNISRLRKLVQ